MRDEMLDEFALAFHAGRLVLEKWQRSNRIPLADSALWKALTLLSLPKTHDFSTPVMSQAEAAQSRPHLSRRPMCHFRRF